ncbi:MAG: nucleotidyltransferase domain-containing protein [Candidatus Omnitrophica bacterium]|nr:nucleotidyltransferase domain-containing protein [Candidatus Omnitrophota bacterium]
MLKTEAPIGQIVNEVADFLSKYIKVNKLILFGSYGSGNPSKESDFDIAVISEDLEKMTILERMKLFSKAAILVDSRVELKGFGRSEFLKPEKASLLKMIKEEGKVVYSD